MFEPENDIEHLLIRASAEPAERPGFARALIGAQIFVVLVSDGDPLVPGADGKATVPAGAKLTLPSAMRGEERLIPFFTAPSRARIWFKGEHIVAPDCTRDLFSRYPDTPFVLNPGSDYGKDFTPGEIKRLLAGQFEDGPQIMTITAPEPILLGHPKEVPTALIEALKCELGGVKSIRGAWLMLASRAGQPEQSWMLGVDDAGPWHEVQAAIGRALAGDVLKGRMLDALPLEGNSLASTLRTGIPLIAATQKRGFLQKLFR